MGKNKNKYSTIIRVKNHQEKIARLELDTIKKQKNHEIELLNDLEETKEFAINGSVKILKLQAKDVQANRAYIQQLRKQMQEQLKKIEKIQDKENGKRNELVEKSQSRRVIEKLEERRLAEITIESNRKEQRLMDVLASRIQWENT